MDQIFTYILILLNLSGTITKYTYINKTLHWLEAQSYCQQNYTDLAPVSNKNDVDKLQQLSSNVTGYIWIGLRRNSSDRQKWLWSGGGAVSWTFWAPGQPDDYNSDEDFGLLSHNLWYDVSSSYDATIFCYSAVVVREEKTWEEALEYCREQHNDLASVASETEMILIQKELNKNSTTDHVWIGLHFFSGDWLWVDGQELNYKAWGQGGKPSCPNAKMECAALQVTGGNESVWEAHDCEEKLQFVCY